MNETIRRILAESGTKTSKIRKLLLIGLSHREIADLLTVETVASCGTSIRE